MIRKKFTASLLVAALALSFAVIGVAPAKAAGFTDQDADMGDLFVLDKLFRGNGNSRILSNSDGANLGNLFILDKLFNDRGQEVVAVAPSVADRVAGKIVIQVEENGEAWYVSPASKERTYLNGPNTAYQVMADMALGISNDDFDAINTGDSADVPSRVVGRFLLKVEDSGKMYYVNPTDKSITMIASPADAQSIITSTGIGISNNDIAKIAVAD